MVSENWLGEGSTQEDFSSKKLLLVGIQLVAHLYESILIAITDWCLH